MDIIQIQEIIDSLKEKIISLEQENLNLKSKSGEADQNLISKLQEEIMILKDNVNEKDLIITSLNDEMKILNEKIAKLERNNYTLERTCESLSRFEKYCELLENEKAEIQKVIVVINY